MQNRKNKQNDAEISEDKKQGTKTLVKQYAKLAASSGCKSLFNLLSNKLGISLAEIDDYWGFIEAWNIILIFDDFERARVKLNSLMGYMCNFIEEYGIKTIIVGDEKEIFNNFFHNDYSNKVITVKDLELPAEKKEAFLGTSVNIGVKKIENSKEYLDAKIKYFLNPSRNYERIKEKLIGYTYNFNPNLEKCFLELSGNDKALIDNIREIINSFDYYDSKNIRTFIFAKKIFLDYSLCFNEMEICNENDIKNEIYKILIKEIFEQSLEIKSPRIPKNQFDGMFHVSDYEPAAVKNIIHDLVAEYLASMIIDKTKVEDSLKKCENLIKEYKNNYKKSVSSINFNFLTKEDEYVKSRMDKVLSYLNNNDLNIRAYPKFISIIYYYNSIFSKKIELQGVLETMKKNIMEEPNKIGDTFESRMDLQKAKGSAKENMEMILDSIKKHDLNVGNDKLNEMLQEEGWAKKIYEEVYKHSNLYRENFICFIDIDDLCGKIISGRSIDVVDVLDTLDYVYGSNFNKGNYNNEICSLKDLSDKLSNNKKNIEGETHNAAITELVRKLPNWIDDLTKRNNQIV